MALTRDFRDTVKARAEADPAFRAGLYQEAVQAVVDGDLPTARVLLRDYINATVGFVQLGRDMDAPDKSLVRMFGPSGNPRADNLLAVLRALRGAQRVTVAVQPERKRRRVPQAEAAA
mgnify:CR=1 FL=1